MPAIKPYPDRREFLTALTAGLALHKFPWPLTERAAFKTLAQYQSEGATYSAALNAVNVTPTSLSAHSALSARVGSGLTLRVSWLVAQAAQDPRVVAGIKPLVASSTAFDAFSKAVTSDLRAVLNVPGVQAALADAVAKDAALRRVALSKNVAFVRLIRQELNGSGITNRTAELDAIERRVVEANLASAAAVVLAAVIIVVAIIVAVATFGAGAGIVAGSVAAASVSAAVLASFGQKVEEKVTETGDSLQRCLDSAASRRRSCMNAIKTTNPFQREYEAGLCQASYLADVLACAG
jgi:hypothetical protein